MTNVRYLNARVRGRYGVLTDPHVARYHVTETEGPLRDYWEFLTPGMDRTAVVQAPHSLLPGHPEYEPFFDSPDFGRPAVGGLPPSCRPAPASAARPAEENFTATNPVEQSDLSNPAVASSTLSSTPRGASVPRGGGRKAA